MSVVNFQQKMPRWVDREMIYEERTYTLHPATVGQFLDAYEREGVEAHQRHLGKQLGSFVTDTGTLNQLVQIWEFEDMARAV